MSARYATPSSPAPARAARVEDHDRLAFLAEAGRVLAASLDHAETLRSMARLLVPALGDWCAIVLVDERGEAHTAALAAADAQREAGLSRLLGRYPDHFTRAVHPAGRVLRSGAPLLLPTIGPEALEEVAENGEHLRLLEELGHRTALVVPLAAHGRVLGALTLASGRPEHRYTAADLALAEELAARAALAVENARLYRAAQEAQERAERAADRTARLQAVTGALSEALTPEEVADVVVGQGVAAMGGICGGVAQLSPDGATFHMLRSVGVPEEIAREWHRFPAHARSPMCDAVRLHQPVLIGSAEVLKLRYPEFASLHLTFTQGAVVAVPLLVDGEAIGALGLSFAGWREFSPEDESFLLAVAGQCAQALQRARLYAAERQARAEAESAAQARDGVLGYVAHDLRNPLNAITLLSGLLQDGGLAEETRQRYLRSIVRSTQQMEHLIQDLLDVTRVEAGRLRVDPRPTPATALVGAVQGMLEVEAAERGLRLALQLSPGLPRVLADRDRVQQVFQNLVANALKFTPRGGLVTLGAAEAGHSVRFFVSDSGVGIPADHLPHLFDRFWQAHQARSGGTGLGLAIAKGIVEEHGGRIGAESAVGAGSTFWFTLPRAPDPAPGAPLPAPTT